MWHKAEWIKHPMRLELTRECLLVLLANHYTIRGPQHLSYSNLRCYLLRCSTRPNEWKTQWESNSLVKVCKSRLVTITIRNAPLHVCCTYLVSKNHDYISILFFHMQIIYNYCPISHQWENTSWNLSQRKWSPNQNSNKPKDIINNNLENFNTPDQR